jgi:anti-anti-sigma regulatory factor
MPRKRSEQISEEEGQRQRVLRILALTLLVGGGLYGLVAAVLYFQEAGPLADAAGGLVISLVGGFVFLLCQRGLVRAGSILAVGLLLAIPIFYLTIEGTRTTSILFFAGGVVFADLLIGGQSSLIVAAIGTLAYLGFGIAFENGYLEVTSISPFLNNLVSVIAINFSLALVAGSFTRGMLYAMVQARDREAALRAANAEKERLLAELHTREEAQRQLLETVRELGSPIIPLAEGIIAMPLIGVVDSERMQLIRRDLLRGVSENRAHTVLVDITGVPIVDAAVASALVQAMIGVQLLGAEPVLTGIRSEVAQTIVELGLDLSSIVAWATLQEGLAYALRAGGMEKN